MTTIIGPWRPRYAPKWFFVVDLVHEKETETQSPAIDWLPGWPFACQLEHHALKLLRTTAAEFGMTASELLAELAISP